MRRQWNAPHVYYSSFRFAIIFHCSSVCFPFITKCMPHILEGSRHQVWWCTYSTSRCVRFKSSSSKKECHFNEYDKIRRMSSSWSRSKILWQRQILLGVNFTAYSINQTSIFMLGACHEVCFVYTSIVVIRLLASFHCFFRFLGISTYHHIHTRGSVVAI